MLTDIYWQEYVAKVQRVMHDYDLYIHGYKVVEVDSNNYIVYTNDNPNKRTIKYKFPESFRDKIVTFSYLQGITEVKTKPEKIVNTTLDKIP